MSDYKRIVTEGLENLGILSREQIQQALKVQTRSKRRFGQVLVQLGLIANENISLSLAPQFGILPQPINVSKLSSQIKALLNPQLAVSHRIIPLKADQHSMTLATDNLFNFLAVDNLKKFLEIKLKIALIYVE